MRPEPDPHVIESLCHEYPAASRADILACWHNASLHWFEIPPDVLANEPRELTAARALFVHATLCGERGESAEHYAGMWALVLLYSQRKG